MIQTTYLCVILHVKHKQIINSNGFYLILILDKIQGGDYVWWR